MLDDVIRAGAEATLTWLTTKDPGLKQLLDEAYGYAVFPALGRASAVLGGARGHGEVFEEGKPIGFATLTQMTVGVQVGGQTFSELILFGNKDALEAFKKGKVRFTANASAVFVRAGATGITDFPEVVAKAYSRGGMLLGASLGGQKVTFHEHLPEKKKKRESKQGTRYETKVAEERPEEAFETAPEEGGGYEAGAGEETQPERAVAAPERDEGNDAVLSEGAAEPGGAGSTATRAIEPQGHTGSAQHAGVVAKAGSGIRRRFAGTGRRLVRKVARSKRAVKRRVKRVALNLAAKRYPTLVGKPLRLFDRINAAATGIENEATLGPVLSAEVNAALRRMAERDPGLNEMLEKAYGYAVFPLVGKAAAALGIGFGRGEVFERGNLIGYAGIVQLTVGAQVGGETYDELIVFENEDALERFKDGKLAFAAKASAVIVKAGAAATTNYSSGTAVFVHPAGGLMLELGSGIQKFMFRRKVLGAPEIKPPTVNAPEVQSKAPTADETRPAQSERAPPEVKTTEAKAEGTAEERKGGATEAAATEAARTARARMEAAAATARTKATGTRARMEATAAAARTKATAAVGDAGTAVKRGIGAFMRRPRSRP